MDQGQKGGKYQNYGTLQILDVRDQADRVWEKPGITAGSLASMVEARVQELEFNR